MEETAALARHLATPTEAGEDPASQPRETARWAASLAETVRARMRDTREGQRE